MNDDFLKGKKVLSVISTDDFVDDSASHRRQIIGSLSSATDIPWNRIDMICGVTIDHCIKHHYNDRVIMATAFSRIWDSEVEQFDDDELDDDDKIRGLR